MGDHNNRGEHVRGDAGYFREINKLRVKEVKTCPVCGDGFEGLKVQIFCSNKCNMKRKRERKAAAKRAEFYGGVK